MSFFKPILFKDSIGDSESALLRLQNAVLELIATGATLTTTCRRICEEVESILPDVICSILTVDADGILHSIAAPSLPAEFSHALDGMAIGPLSASRGSATCLRFDVAITDLDTDARWVQLEHLACLHGLVACWSSPICNADGRTIATFACYYRALRNQTKFEQKVVASCTHLCIIAIDQHQRVVEHERQAFSDALTGLPNRAAFNASLLELNGREPGSWALFVLDLDNLKVVNDTFGHHAGDQLLQVVGDRVSMAARPCRTFRIGGDEFAVIFESRDAERQLEITAKRVLEALLIPEDCGGQIIVPRATIGGAVASGDEPFADKLRRNADFALYHAKETGVAASCATGLALGQT